jgi:hypothetical protein
VRVNARIPAFEELYSPAFGKPLTAVAEETLTIDPPPNRLIARIS